VQIEIDDVQLQSNRCENCQKEIGATMWGLVRAQRLACWTSGEIICIGCETDGRCAKCFRQEEEKRSFSKAASPSFGFVTPMLPMLMRMGAEMTRQEAPHGDVAPTTMDSSKAATKALRRQTEGTDEYNRWKKWKEQILKEEQEKSRIAEKRSRDDKMRSLASTSFEPGRASGSSTDQDMDKNKTTRCENCHRAIGGIFRIEQKNCWACGDAICTRCELYGQCEKCHKQDEEMRAVHESSDDDEEEEDDEDKDEGQGRPKKLRRLNDGKVKVCESCGNYSDTLRIKKVNATILGDCISRNDSWMIVCNDCSRGIDRSIGEDMSSCSDTSGYGEEGKEDEQGEEEEQTAEEVVEEDEPFILQWEQDDEAGDEQPEGPADVINPDVVQEGFHAGFTIGVSEYVDKQRNSRS
jgi:hypothetical protein